MVYVHTTLRAAALDFPRLSPNQQKRRLHSTSIESNLSSFPPLPLNAKKVAFHPSVTDHLNPDVECTSMNKPNEVDLQQALKQLIATQALVRERSWGLQNVQWILAEEMMQVEGLLNLASQKQRQARDVFLAYQNRNAIILQKHVRGYQVRSFMFRWRRNQAAIGVQRYVRRYLARRVLARLRVERSVIMIQCIVRGHRIRKQILARLMEIRATCATRIQRRWRRSLHHLQAMKMHDAYERMVHKKEVLKSFQRKAHLAFRRREQLRAMDEMEDGNEQIKKDARKSMDRRKTFALLLAQRHREEIQRAREKYIRQKIRHQASPTRHANLFPSVPALSDGSA